MSGLGTVQLLGDYYCPPCQQVVSGAYSLHRGGIQSANGDEAPADYRFLGTGCCEERQEALGLV